jgi:putative SOS response-associated peptidase YedK
MTQLLKANMEIDQSLPSGARKRAQQPRRDMDKVVASGWHGWSIGKGFVWHDRMTRTTPHLSNARVETIGTKRVWQRSHR